MTGNTRSAYFATQGDAQLRPHYRRLICHDYLNLDRRFGFLTKYSVEELFSSEVLGKQLTRDRVLEGRFSLVIARGNLGKSTELAACAKRLRETRAHAVFLAAA